MNRPVRPDELGPPVEAGAGISPDRSDMGEALRAETRALALRSARLVGASGEYLCILRDVSASGLKLRLFHPLPAGERFAVVLDEDQRCDVVLAWTKQDTAGFQFASPRDLAGFLAPVGLWPRRPLRLAVDHRAEVHAAGRVVPARVVNLSRQGACFEAEQRLPVGQALRVTSALLGDREATICWRRAPRHGLVFRDALPAEDLALTVHAMQAERFNPDES